MREYIVIKIILFMLNTNVGIKEESLSNHSKCYLYRLAQAIVRNAANDSEIASLIAIGYKESKFNYQGIKHFTSPNGKHCGIYQQSPQFAKLEGKRLNCKDLQSSETATAQAVNYLHYIADAYGKGWESICHYNSGNSCNNGSRRYAKDYKSKYDKVMKMIGGKNKSFDSFSTESLGDYEQKCVGFK